MTSPEMEDLLARDDASLRERRTAVYRFFDADDHLLYVGITADLIVRWRWHEKHAEWWPRQHRAEVIWRSNRDEAAGEEGYALRTEGPIHNIAIPGRTPRRTIRMDETRWEKFGASAAAVGSDRSEVLRALTDWFNGEPGAELPERPAPTED